MTIQFEGDVAKMFVLAVLASKDSSLVARAFILVASELGYTLTPTDLEPVLKNLEREGRVVRGNSVHVSGGFASSQETWRLV